MARKFEGMLKGKNIKGNSFSILVYRADYIPKMIPKSEKKLWNPKLKGDYATIICMQRQGRGFRIRM